MYSISAFNSPSFQQLFAPLYLTPEYPSKLSLTAPLRSSILSQHSISALFAAPHVDMAPPTYLSVHPVLEIIAGGFTVTFIAAGTVVLIYALDIKRPIPPKIIIALVVAFVVLFIMVGVTLLVHHVLIIRDAKKKYQVYGVAELEGKPVRQHDSVSEDGFESQEMYHPRRPQNAHIPKVETTKSETYTHNGVHDESYSAMSIPESRRGPHQVRAPLRIRVPTPEEYCRMNEQTPFPVSMTPKTDEEIERLKREQANNEDQPKHGKLRKPSSTYTLPRALESTYQPSQKSNEVAWNDEVSEESDSGTSYPLQYMSPVSPLTTIFAPKSSSSVYSQNTSATAEAETQNLLSVGSDGHVPRERADRASHKASRARIDGFINKFRRERASREQGSGCFIG